MNKIERVRWFFNVLLPIVGTQSKGRGLPMPEAPDDDPQAAVDRLRGKWGDRWGFGYDGCLYTARRLAGDGDDELGASDPDALSDWLTAWEKARAAGGWDISVCRLAFPAHTGYTFTREQGQIVARREGSPTVRDVSHLVILALLRARRDPEQVTDAQPPKPWLHGK